MKGINNDLRKLILRGALLRFAFLGLVLLLYNVADFSPFAFSDDITYEEKAQSYIKYAHGLIDMETIVSLHLDWELQIFWYYLMCFSGKLFGTVYAGRILNCIFSTITIYLAYKITLRLSNTEQTAYRVAKMCAYFPVLWTLCAFPIKDVFIMMAVLYVLDFVVKLQLNHAIRIWEIALVIVTCVCIFLARGAVVEFLGLVAGVFLLERFYLTKQYGKLILSFAVVFVLLYVMQESIFGAFETKIDIYNSEDTISKGFLSNIQIMKISDLYKLPFTYFFAIIQPMTMNVFNFEWQDWSPFVRLLNLTAYPIAFGNLAYVVCKKQNFMFWLSTFVMFCSIIAMSLGTYRHYYFMYPIHLINYVFVKEFNSSTINSFIKTGTVALLLVVIFLSIVL